jgi:voltage-gated potassium channel
MILLAIWILIEWYLRNKNVYSASFDQATDIIIWLFFVLETIALTSLVNDKVHYLRTNWMNLLIISIGIPLLWIGSSYAAILRTLRLLLILPLLLNASVSIRNVLSRNYLGSVLLSALAFTLMSGLLMAGIDPNIDSIWHGMWWSWVTVSTVGYGDTVPVSTAGKIFGAVVILFGVGFFSLLTASFSAYFVSRGEVEIEEEEEEEISQLTEIKQRIEVMEKTLKRIERKLSDDDT